jgi:hypothetical protein
MSPMVNHRASLVSTWSPPGLPLSGRAWKHIANGWRTSLARGSTLLVTATDEILGTHSDGAAVPAGDT